MSNKDRSPKPDLIQPHPNLDGSINEAFRASEIEGGVHVNELPVGTKLKIRTENTTYLLEIRPDGKYISGHPTICPNPTLVTIDGSTWSGSMMKVGYVGVGMRLKFNTPTKKNQITSVIKTFQILE